MSYEQQEITIAPIQTVPSLSLEECDETFTKGVLLIEDAVLNYAKHGLTAGEIGKRVRGLGGKIGDSTVARWVAGFKAEKLLPEKPPSERTERRHKQQERERPNSQTEKMSGAVAEAEVIDVTPNPAMERLLAEARERRLQREEEKAEMNGKIDDLNQEVGRLQKQLQKEQYFHRETQLKRVKADDHRDEILAESAPVWREVHSLRKQLAEVTAQLETQGEVQPESSGVDDQSKKIGRLQKLLKERDRKIVKLKALIPNGVTNLPNIELEAWEETDEERLRQYPTSNQARFTSNKAGVAKWNREDYFVAAEPLGELLGELRGRVNCSIGAYSTDEVQKIARSLRWMAHSVQEEFLDRGKPTPDGTTSTVASSTLRRASGDVIDI